MLCSSLCPALLLSRRLLPGVSSYIAAEKKKVRRLIVCRIAYLCTPEVKNSNLCWCFLLAPIEMRSRFFVRPYHQKSNYPPMLSCRFIVPWELDFAGEVDSQSLFPFPSPLRIVLRSIVKQEAYCHDLFPSTSFDVRVLKKKMPSDSSLDLGKDQRAKGSV